MTYLTRSTHVIRPAASSTKPIEAGSCRGWRPKHGAARTPARSHRRFDAEGSAPNAPAEIRKTMAQRIGTAPNAMTAARPTRARRRLKELRPLLWFVPVLLLLLTVTLYPTLFVVWMSFQKTRFYDLAGFVGLANYVDTLSSRAFWETTYTSLVYMLGSLVLSLGLGVLAALVLNNLTRGGAVLRVLTLVPWTLSMAVVGTIWLWLFNPSYGPISYSMRQLGVSPGLMLGDPELALWLTILVTSWWSFPYAMVIVTAAIQSIPKELYEAVAIDGGSWRAKLRYVTWPHLIPTDRKSTRLNSSHDQISYAVFCLKKKIQLPHAGRLVNGRGLSRCVHTRARVTPRLLPPRGERRGLRRPQARPAPPALRAHHRALS